MIKNKIFTKISPILVHSVYLFKKKKTYKTINTAKKVHFYLTIFLYQLVLAKVAYRLVISTGTNTHFLLFISIYYLNN